MTYREDPLIAQRYKSKKWQRLRKLKLIATNGLCERCLAKGIYNSAKIIHHKEYITELNYEDDNVFFDIDNLESLCQECHNREHHGEEDPYIFDAERKSSKTGYRPPLDHKTRQLGERRAGLRKMHRKNYISPI